MSVAVQAAWTTEQFLAWTASQEGRYEFDGARPVAMTGGTIHHAIIMRNLHRALDRRLRGSACQPLGPDAGVVTLGSAIRYPDALVTCSRQDGSARTMEGVVAAFEIVSPSMSRTDRIEKVREYAVVASIRRYVIVESTTAGVLVLHRNSANDPWLADVLTADDVIAIPEIRMEIPVAELYEDVDLAAPPASVPGQP